MFEYTATYMAWSIYTILLKYGLKNFIGMTPDHLDSIFTMKISRFTTACHIILFLFKGL